MCRWPPRGPVSAIPSAVGVSALCSTASSAGRMRRAQGARGAFPPAARVPVLSIATQKPTTYHWPAPRWSLDDLGVPLQPRPGAQARSRSSLWRLLEEADLKPHRSVYWLHRHDWVVHNLHTHWSLAVGQLVAHWGDVPSLPKARRRGVQRRAFLSDPTHRHVLHFTPKHGAWLNQVALWWRVLARRFLTRGDF